LPGELPVGCVAERTCRLSTRTRQERVNAYIASLLRVLCRSVACRSVASAWRVLLPPTGLLGVLGGRHRRLLAPEEDRAAFAVSVINNAEREILVGAYGMTRGSGIVEALVRAKERGVDVRLIADRTFYSSVRPVRCSSTARLDRCREAGAPQSPNQDDRERSLSALAADPNAARAILAKFGPMGPAPARPARSPTPEEHASPMHSSPRSRSSGFRVGYSPD
jgi:PLD-like domain